MTTIAKLPEQVMYEPFLTLVADPTNWKNPIDATVEVPSGASDRKLFLDLLSRAVSFYCGCVARISDAGANKVRVVADGYYLAVGS
jgi:hypothetical protein